jgi:F0F1-type ATP synthase assembly protein I
VDHATVIAQGLIADIAARSHGQSTELDGEEQTSRNQVAHAFRVGSDQLRGRTDAAAIA